MIFSVERMKVNVDIFEGPLDLLLHLIKRDDLDIYDIPIAHITAEYLSYLDVMEELNLDIAGDFLVMAATLAQIKSRMLLPRPEGEVDKPEEDPREELMRKLIEYQRFKEASQLLEQREILQYDVFGHPPEPQHDTVALADERVDTTLFELVSALKHVIARLPEERVHEVMREEISITTRIYQVIERLKGRPRVEFEELFTDVQNKGLVIITFLSVLELMKRRLVKVQQAMQGTIIHIFPTGNFDDLGEVNFEDYGGTAAAPAEEEA